jgi:hypothetical protein
MTIMIDGVGTDVPAILERFGRHHPVQAYIWQPGVLSYIPWSAGQLAEFPGHMLTATRGGRPEDAKWARELDRETGDALDEDVAPWLISRHEFGHKDGGIYVDMVNLAGVLEAINQAGLWDEPWWRIRIAWYWQRPSAPRLYDILMMANSYLGGTGLTLEARRVWACQWSGSPTVDINEVYGAPDFTR